MLSLIRLSLNIYMMSEFISRDLYISALCYAKRAKFNGIKREGKTCWFIFDDAENCKTLQEKYFAKTIEVNAKEFVDAIRTLKDLVFAEG